MLGVQLTWHQTEILGDSSLGHGSRNQHCIVRTHELEPFIGCFDVVK